MTKSLVYLLDTSIVSELRKTKPHRAVSAWFRSVQKELIAISAVVVGEIQTGVEITRHQDQAKAREIELWLERVLAFYDVIPMDAAIFREWARLMIGKSDHLSRDGMIAATARERRMKIITRNIKDFSDFDVEIFNPFSYSERDPV